MIFRWNFLKKGKRQRFDFPQISEEDVLCVCGGGAKYTPDYVP